MSLLALAHERGCEAALAAALDEQMQRPGAAGAAVVDVAALQRRFAPAAGTLPDIAVTLPFGRQLRRPSAVARSRRVNDSPAT